MRKNVVQMKQIVEKMNLKNLTPDVELSDKAVEVPDINRPALQLTGFFERFDSERVQVIGYVEYSYLTTLEEKKKEEIYDTLLSYKIPCLVFCRALKPDDMLLQKATEANIPVFSTDSHTSAFMAEIIRWLNVQLAPCISIHGVLVDVYGVGVLIMGESGIGKSEAALELIKRGHRLVSDDVVEIRKVSDETLVGTAPDITRHFIELRGIGIVDVKTLFGVQSVREYDTLLSYKIPCLVFCRALKPDDMLLQKATEANIPVFSTDSHTSAFMAEIIRWLNVQLAPCISIHGVLVDVYGVGVLIMGESGIGKSEAALELIKRGHRLVSDDVVEIRKVSDETLVGTAPDITRHFIELRGIGIVDVKTLFGVQSVRETKNIDLVITLEEWNKEREYDRLGLEDQYTEFLGNKVVCHNLPIRPGRNLAIIVETAAINHRQKSMGYNAAQELYQRVQRNLTKKD